MGGLGKESSFEFKYIPNLDLTTELGRQEDSGLGHSGVEWRNLKALFVASMLIGLLSWLMTKGASVIVAKLS